MRRIVCPRLRVRSWTGMCVAGVAVVVATLVLGACRERAGAGEPLPPDEAGVQPVQGQSADQDAVAVVDPFAAYVVEIQPGIHEAWACGFLQDVQDPLGDELWTRVQMVLTRAGEIDEVSTVHDSSDPGFDAAARDAVRGVGPLPKPPPEILCSDGKLYVHWALHRHDPVCGKLDAQPELEVRLRPGHGGDEIERAVAWCPDPAGAQEPPPDEAPMGEQPGQSPLENMVPVSAGNRTAPRSRTHPLAEYVVRIHRGIHEGWAWGFLEALDTRGGEHRLNDYDLWTRVEIVLTSDGEIVEVATVHTSGKPGFDAAAREVVRAAGPFPAPPPEIVSGNGTIHIHWALHRDERACGTFGAQPFILDAAGRGDRPDPNLEVRVGKGGGGGT